MLRYSRSKRKADSNNVHNTILSSFSTLLLSATDDANKNERVVETSSPAPPLPHYLQQHTDSKTCLEQTHWLLSALISWRQPLMNCH